MDRNSRIIRNLEWCAGNDLVLRIQEGKYNNNNEKREMSTQTSPFLSSFKKFANPDLWNSEESILRSLGNTDEDNK